MVQMKATSRVETICQTGKTEGIHIVPRSDILFLMFTVHSENASYAYTYVLCHVSSISTNCAFSIFLVLYK